MLHGSKSRFGMLMMTRYQRLEALSVVHSVNSAFDLPTPPSLLRTAAIGLENFFTGFRRILVSYDQEPVRVSLND